MKYKLSLILCCFIVIFNCISCFSQFNTDFTVMSYNIKTFSKSGGYKSWEYRKPYLISTLKDINIDIICLQEVRGVQQRDIYRALNNSCVYGLIGQLGLDMEHTPILYNKRRFRALKEGSFFLSETPDIESIGWDAKYLKMCYWTLLKDRVTKKNIYVFNTHWDPSGKEARYESAKLIESKILEINTGNYPVVITGDLNEQFNGGEGVKYITRKYHSSLHMTTNIYGPSTTFNGFDLDYQNNNKKNHKVDYILASPNLEVKRYEIIENRTQDNFVSDHFPIVVKMSYK